MPATTTSGANPTPNSSAKSRDHNQGNQDRSYTIEQKTAVLRVRRCPPTAFYDILGLEEVKKTVTDTEIKKAYRKLSLLTHPDKNGHEHADEAFKMVSRAFGVLGDKDKRTQFDRYGGDPDSRFGSGGGGGGQSASPFSGFAGGARAARSEGGGRGVWEEEISPEEMFNRFFGGGGMGGFGGGPFGGGGMFDQGPGFVFNLGGGPGIRVHQFGGARPRRRPRDPNAAEEPPASLRSTIIGLLPLLIIFILPLLSSLFQGGGSASTPSMRFDGSKAPHTQHRITKKMKVDYYINPVDVEHYTPYKFSQLDNIAEVNFVRQLNIGCERELDAKQQLVNDAQGWFSQDQDKMQRANEMELPNCQELERRRLPRSTY